MGFIDGIVEGNWVKGSLGGYIEDDDGVDLVGLHYCQLVVFAEGYRFGDWGQGWSWGDESCNRSEIYWEVEEDQLGRVAPNHTDFMLWGDVDLVEDSWHGEERRSDGNSLDLFDLSWRERRNQLRESVGFVRKEGIGRLRQGAEGMTVGNSVVQWVDNMHIYIVGGMISEEKNIGLCLWNWEVNHIAEGRVECVREEVEVVFHGTLEDVVGSEVVELIRAGYHFSTTIRERSRSWDCGRGDSVKGYDGIREGVVDREGEGDEEGDH